MADNIPVTPGSGVSVATDDISSVHYQIVKVAFGTDGSVTLVDASNGLPVNVRAVAIPATFYHGQMNVTTAGTELVLASSQALLSGVTVKAKHANTGWIYVGTNPVTLTTGFVLDAGEQIFIEVDNLADIYIDCSVSGEGVSFLAS